MNSPNVKIVLHQSFRNSPYAGVLHTLNKPGTWSIRVKSLRNPSDNRCRMESRITYHMSRGTFRNKISVLMKRSKVEWLCDSPQGFYILKELGQNTNTITNDDHTGVNRLNHISYKDKKMNQSSDLVDEMISDGESCRLKIPALLQISHSTDT